MDNSCNLNCLLLFLQRDNFYKGQVDSFSGFCAALLCKPRRTELSDLICEPMEVTSEQLQKMIYSEGFPEEARFDDFWIAKYHQSQYSPMWNSCLLQQPASCWCNIASTGKNLSPREVTSEQLQKMIYSEGFPEEARFDEQGNLYEENFYVSLQRRMETHRKKSVSQAIRSDSIHPIACLLRTKDQSPLSSCPYTNTGSPSFNIVTANLSISPICSFR